MKTIRRTTISGHVQEIEDYTAIRSKGKNLPRGANVRESTAKQKILNEIYAKRWMARIINNNFGPGDTYITPTYDNRAPLPSPAQARIDLQRYLRRLRDYCKAHNLPKLKYVWVTEYSESRVHHHIVLSAMPEQVLRELWQLDAKGKPIPGRGRCAYDRLDYSLDYTFLGRYLVKEERPGKRWGKSLGLKPPKVKEQEITRAAIRKKYRPPKGWRVEEEIFDYSPISGEHRYVRIVEYCKRPKGKSGSG